MIRYPLQPRDDASAECLFNRLDQIDRNLRHRGFSDAAIDFAKSVVADVGSCALLSKKTQAMTPSERAAWLWKVAINAARRYAKQEKPCKSLDAVAHLLVHWTVTDNDDCSPVMAILEEELAHLPKQMKKVLELRFWSGLSEREIAKILGIANAHNRIVKAQNALRQAIMERITEDFCREIA